MQGRAEGTLDRLNDPLRVDEAPRPNRHDPSQTDTVRTLYYDGMEIGIYDVSASGQRLVTPQALDASPG